MTQFDHITNATNDLLAERLEEFNNWRKSYVHGMPMPFTAEELGVIIDEAARRLRIKPREIFNHEAFE